MDEKFQIIIATMDAHCQKEKDKENADRRCEVSPRLLAGKSSVSESYTE